MSDNKNYYYLKLKDDFFDSDAMILLENMQDGYLYSNILLKLYLRSLKDEGRLMFNNRIPYNASALAQVTRHSVGTIEKALDIFQEFELVEVLSNGAIFISDIQNFIGSSSSEADRKRAYRRRIDQEKDTQKIESGQMSRQTSDKSPPEIEIELELEKELEKDKTISRKLKTVYDKEHFQLAELLYSEMLQNNPKAKKPNLENWSNDIRLMVERDGRSLSDISYMIKWSQNDSFWSTNVLSTSKLRKQYDQLYMKAKQEHEAKTGTTTGKQQLTQEDWANM